MLLEDILKFPTTALTVLRDHILSGKNNPIGQAVVFPAS